MAHPSETPAGGPGSDPLPAWAVTASSRSLLTLAALLCYRRDHLDVPVLRRGELPDPPITNGGRGPATVPSHTRPSHLAAATTAPEPAPPSLAGAPPLQSHEVFGYAPYWTLPQSSGFDVQDLTTLAYFSVDANGDGSLDESGSGWNGYESQDLVDLVNRAHAAGDRVVLTVTCFSQTSLDQITSDPSAAGRLSAALISRGLCQGARRGQLRLRGGGKRRPGRAHLPDHPGVGGTPRDQSALAGQHGHLRQRGG